MKSIENRPQILHGEDLLMELSLQVTSTDSSMYENTEIDTDFFLPGFGDNCIAF